MYLGYKEQNCIVYFLNMQQTNKGELTVMASYGCYEAMAVRIHPLVFFVAEKEAY